MAWAEKDNPFCPFCCCCFWVFTENTKQSYPYYSNRSFYIRVSRKRQQQTKKRQTYYKETDKRMRSRRWSSTSERPKSFGFSSVSIIDAPRALFYFDGRFSRIHAKWKTRTGKTRAISDQYSVIFINEKPISAFGANTVDSLFKHCKRPLSFTLMATHQEERAFVAALRPKHCH